MIIDLSVSGNWPIKTKLTSNIVYFKQRLGPWPFYLTGLFFE